MGGEETIKKLKAIETFKTPVVALTADALSGAEEKYLSLGFDGYMCKPFSREMIAKKLYSVFSNEKPKSVEEVKQEKIQEMLSTVIPQAQNVVIENVTINENPVILQQDQNEK